MIKSLIGITCFVLGAVPAFSAAETSESKPLKRPNILFAIADDMSHASAYGHSWVSTPNFDRLAKEGILFKNAFTTSPKCAPSRAATLGGRHFWQMKSGSTHWSIWPNDIKIYTDLLAENGYHVGLTGKGWAPGEYKNRGGRTYNPAGKSYDEHREKPLTSKMSDLDYSENFKEFLKTAKPDQPFCFWYGAIEPHRKYERGSGLKNGLKPESVKVPSYYPDQPAVRSDLLDYALEVNWFDKYLGEIVEHLREIGELDNTLIIATSDNGAPFPRIKGQIYDEDFRLPMVARWGAVHKGGSVVEDFINNIDIAPTFLEAAGVPIPEGMSGRSFLDIFKANASGFIAPDRDSVCVGRECQDLGREEDLGYPVRAIRTKEYLYVHNFAPERWPAGNPETGYTNCDGSPTKDMILELHEKGQSEYFHYAFGKKPKEELYKVTVDPECLTNLADNPKYAKVKKTLWHQLKSTLYETQDPRILGDGDIFERYEYVNRKNGHHSWEAYEENRWRPQKY
ncbi:MAG: sulfatase [Planctomycetes bacterium]|nr:sulfatase [Planctomycetota bacterium]